MARGLGWRWYSVWLAAVRARSNCVLQPGARSGGEIDFSAHLEHFSEACTAPLLRSRYSRSLQGRLHRCAMETCSARIDLYTVIAVIPHDKILAWRYGTDHALQCVGAMIFEREIVCIDNNAWRSRIFQQD